MTEQYTSERESRDAIIAAHHLPSDHWVRRDARRRARNKAKYLGEDESEVGDMPYDNDVNEIAGALFEMTVDTTDFSVREALALVLSEHPTVTYDKASTIMGIARGTYAGKLSNDVRPKIERSKHTVEFADSIESAW